MTNPETADSESPPPQQGVDFSMVIASAVHDMKNSLALLMQAQSNLLHRLPDDLAWGTDRGIIEYESARMNGLMVQLLGLYKLDVNQLPMQATWHEVDDFVGEQLARISEILQARHIDYRYEVEPFDLMGFFDRDLVGSVISNILTNSIRYARSAIELRAWQEGEYLVLSVSDDGRGYPEAMIRDQAHYILGIKQATGSTGLGLYFSNCIARMHQRNGMSGHMELRNNGPLGGGEFRLYLP